MDASLLNPDIQRYINAHLAADVSKLALSKNPFPEVGWAEILNQIAAKSKAKDKLPTWFGTENILYPSKISIEQTSSETTAKYKATLVSGQSLIDLTGGFGVDDFYFSKTVKNIVHCEINAELSKIANHNFEKLGAANIECKPGDGHGILKFLNRKFDWIYIDPSRRNVAKGKVFLLKDCLPDVPGNLDFYFGFSINILVKTAPLLDISAGLAELENVKAIHIVAVKNEVKELLWELEKEYSGPIAIKTANLNNDMAETFDFHLDAIAHATLGKPERYLYEPNAAIMKSGGFEAVGQFFGLNKLHRHSHLYTSNSLVGFPGRIFEINQIFPYTKTGMKQLALSGKMNITTRNFPDSVESIRKKWKIVDGGDQFSFFTTDWDNNKIVLICTKIK